MTAYQIGQKILAQENSEKGFTLIELLIGMAIFAIGFLALAGLQTHSANMNTAARRSMEIEAHVARLAENYRNIAWNDIDNDGVIDNVDVDGDGAVDVPNIYDVDGDGAAGLDHTGAAADYFTNGGVLRPGDNYQLSINVADNVLEPETRSINIIVQWVQQGQNQRYNLRFLKARNV